VCEVALILIGPIAKVLGYDSEKWHADIAKKIMLFFNAGRKDES
jgi:hypothetical protein